MFFASRDAVGPHVVLLQALLRLHGYNLTISGEWQKKTEEAVAHFRTKMALHAKHGPVNGPIMAHLLRGKRIKIVDAIDASAERVFDVGVKSFAKAGEKPVINEKRVGHGVEDAMSRIRKRVADQQIGALRFTGHGNRGTWIAVAVGNPVDAQTEGRWSDYKAMEADWPSYIDYPHFEKMKPILATLAPSFAPFGFVEAHACKIGQQTQLLQGLADVWGVPVSGGLENQSVANGFKDKWGNDVSTTFSLEGEVQTAYPGKLTLAKWAALADQSIPNIPGMMEKGRDAIRGQLKRL